MYSVEILKSVYSACELCTLLKFSLSANKVKHRLRGGKKFQVTVNADIHFVQYCNYQPEVLISSRFKESLLIHLKWEASDIN